MLTCGTRARSRKISPCPKRTEPPHASDLCYKTEPDRHGGYRLGYKASMVKHGSWRAGQELRAGQRAGIRQRVGRAARL